MRRAVVVAPPLFALPPGCSVFAAPEPVGPVCSSLSRGGRRLMLVRSTPALESDLEQALALVGSDDDLVVYLAAETTTRTPRVALRVDDEGGLVELRRLADYVAARRPSAVLFVVEAHHDGDLGDVAFATRYAESIALELGASLHGNGAVVGVLARSVVDGGAWPFTRRFLTALEEASAGEERAAVRVPRIVDMLRSAGPDASGVQGLSLVEGERDLVLIEGERDPVLVELRGVPAPGPSSPISSSGSSDFPAPTAFAPSSDSPEPPMGDSGVDTPRVEVLPMAAFSQEMLESSVASDLVPESSVASDLVPESSVASDLVLESSPIIGPIVATVDSQGALTCIASSMVDGLRDAATLGVATVDAQRVDGARAEPSELTYSAPAPTEPNLPEPRPTQPSLPSMDPLLDLADEAYSREALTEALAAYKAALMVAAPTDPSRVSIYVRMGEIKRRQGKAREAELNFEKALRIDPGHKAALDALVDLATGAHEIRRAIEWRRKRVAGEPPDERVADLLAIAEAYAHDLHDRAAAIEVLDEAKAVDGKSRALIERILVAYENLERWTQVVDVLSVLADSSADPKEKGRLRFAAAEVAMGRLRNESRGIGLLERALDEDPAHDKALQALVAAWSARSEWARIDATYARLVDRLGVLGDVARAREVCQKLGVLRRDKLRDAPGAIEAFAAAMSCKPDDVDTRGMLAEMYLAGGDEARALAELEQIAQGAPTLSNAFGRLFELHLRGGRTDRAWLAGAALEELGAADMDQQLVVDQYRLDGPVRPARSLDDASWGALLRAPGADDLVSDILRAIGTLATTARIDELRQSRKLASIDVARRQSSSSTVSAVRSFQWAAQVLGVKVPDLYLIDNVPGGMAAIQLPTPSTVLGPDVLRGLTAKELAFLAARHLTYYRPEYYALIFYSTLNDISVLFLSAVQTVMPDVAVPPQWRDAVGHTQRLVARLASEEDRNRLEDAVRRLDARGGRVDLAAWIRSVELTAQRAGLLLCGDLAVAVGRLRAEGDTRPIADLTFDAKRSDLLAFCASENLALARALLGVDAHRSVSVAPTAGSAQVG